MFVYINEYGYRVSKKNDLLVVEHTNGETEDYPVNALHAVYFAGEGRISKAILLELAKRNIDILMMSEHGKPMAYIYPLWIKPKTWNLWERQISLGKEKRKYLARKFVIKAIAAKAVLLTELAKSRKRSNNDIAVKLLSYRNRIRGVEKRAKNIRIENFDILKNTLMGLEGFSAKLYFEALRFVIPKEAGYSGTRTRRPPKDLFNSVISFGYAYLKYLVERELVFHGMNPYNGILHNEHDKIYPFLTFDVMEGFRHSFVDRIAIGLISKRVLQVEKHTRNFNGGIYLNKYGRTIVYNALLKERMKRFNKLISKEVTGLIREINN